MPAVYRIKSKNYPAVFFQKNFAFATIYAAGVVIFLQPAADFLLAAGVLGILCLINCMIISVKEQSIDAAMQVRSIAGYLPKLPYPLYGICLIPLFFLRFAATSTLRIPGLTIYDTSWPGDGFP